MLTLLPPTPGHHEEVSRGTARRIGVGSRAILVQPVESQLALDTERALAQGFQTAFLGDGKPIPQVLIEELRFRSRL